MCMHTMHSIWHLLGPAGRQGERCEQEPWALISCACLQRPITLNFRMVMTGWYDIASLEDINQQEDAAGLQESKRSVAQRCVSKLELLLGSNHFKFALTLSIVLTWHDKGAVAASAEGTVDHRPFTRAPEIPSCAE